MNDFSLNLYRLYLHRDSVADTWSAGLDARMEVLKARDYSGFYLVPVPHQPWEEPRLFGLPLRYDPSLPTSRIELRDRNGRILAAWDGTDDDNAANRT